MSTRSYVGMIKDGVVTYGYHHFDSYLEGLGIELFESIVHSYDEHKLKDFAEEPFEEMKEKDFFNYPSKDGCIEYCYGFDVDKETWYVSSWHFSNTKKKFELLDVVQDDRQMKAYLQTYYDEYREGILNEIRTKIVKKDKPVEEKVEEVKKGTKNMTKEFAMKTVEKIGVISDNGKTKVELRITEVNGSEKYDIRSWYEKDGKEKCGKGVRLSKEELLELKKLLKDIK